MVQLIMLSNLFAENLGHLLIFWAPEVRRKNWQEPEFSKSQSAPEKLAKQSIRL